MALLIRRLVGCCAVPIFFALPQLYLFVAWLALSRRAVQDVRLIHHAVNCVAIAAGLLQLLYAGRNVVLLGESSDRWTAIAECASGLLIAIFCIAALTRPHRRSLLAAFALSALAVPPIAYAIWNIARQPNTLRAIVNAAGYLSWVAMVAIPLVELLLLSRLRRCGM